MSNRQRFHLWVEYPFALKRKRPIDTARKPAQSMSQQGVSGLLQYEKTFVILRNCKQKWPSSNSISIVLVQVQAMILLATGINCTATGEINKTSLVVCYVFGRDVY